MNPIVVQKFGGTSLGTHEGRQRAVQKIKTRLGEGYKMVVVVSAMGRQGSPYATDTLLNLLRNYSRKSPRDIDMLMSCGEMISAVILSSLLLTEGLEAVALTGFQAGIMTEGEFGGARIRAVDCDKIQCLLDKEIIPIVAGFQGMNREGEIQTLGRGGSDTTASALALALDAKWLEMYSDVEGVMTADPQKVGELIPLKKVSYGDICEMACQGAGIIHPRAAHIAQKHGLSVAIRSTFSEDGGTWIEVEGSQDCPITSITSSKHLDLYVVHGPEEKGWMEQLDLLAILGSLGFRVDSIAVKDNNVSFFTEKNNRKRMEEVLKEGNWQYYQKINMARVTILGSGMMGFPDLMGRLLTGLKENSIVLYQIMDSRTAIHCLIHENDEERAIQILHQTFHLEGEK